MQSETFGTNVFSPAVMALYLTEAQMRQLQTPGEITMETADAVAEAMGRWAMERGATHYCHWFQPLTGNTAEKHDAFLRGSRDGRAIYGLTGKQLLMGESDASSFPTGGLRGTAYARGYTAWDMTSPVLLKEEAAGRILCIPTVFLSHNGHALDTKTPLLRSMEALDTQCRRILALFGQNLGRIVPFVGVEQEYFLIDRTLYGKRRDLQFCGRTLFGAPAPKGQELDDQYFGTIRQRQGEFMQAVNRQLWRLGIPAAVQHNEVAPAQHELACIYTQANIAADQNQLVMETLQRLAPQFGLVCLLHEKPFAGINGSGKHHNWSIGSEQGENLLDPGKNPEENLRFQLILACILQAVDRHADLLRLSAGNPGNDLRLGGQEAPPAVISVYLGDRLEELVQGILAGTPVADPDAMPLNTGIRAVPAVQTDSSDRNRTSPIAFTGNKFEFRMVGASDSVASANTVLNTIVAEAFSHAADILEGSTDFPGDCRTLICRMLTEHQRILFRGDSYSPEWVAEAARRGLPNLPGMVDAIGALMTPKSIALFEKFRVYSRSELESRTEILWETYAKRIHIEAKTMLHMVSESFLPAAARFARELAETRNALLPAKSPAVETVLQDTLACMEEIFRLREALAGEMESIRSLVDRREIALRCCHHVVPLQSRLRSAVDRLETLVSRQHWPVPTYGDILFEI